MRRFKVGDEVYMVKCQLGEPTITTPAIERICLTLIENSVPLIIQTDIRAAKIYVVKLKKGCHLFNGYEVLMIEKLGYFEEELKLVKVKSWKDVLKCH